LNIINKAPQIYPTHGVTTANLILGFYLISTLENKSVTALRGTWVLNN